MVGFTDLCARGGPSGVHGDDNIRPLQFTIVQQDNKSTEQGDKETMARVRRGSCSRWRIGASVVRTRAWAIVIYRQG